MRRFMGLISGLSLLICALGAPAVAQALTLEHERALKSGDSFRECNACPEMTVVPAGSFTMGSPESEKGRNSWEGPQRVVTFARPFAVGKLIETYRTYPNIGVLLPAMGYGEEQVRDLEATINSVACDVVVIGTPIDLNRLIPIRKPTVRVRYELQEIGHPDLPDVLEPFLAEKKLGTRRLTASR